MLVNRDICCHVCHGPTIHLMDMDLSHRCFFFPECSGQRALFSDARQSLVFLDIETTGLSYLSDHIIEIGAIKIDTDGCEYMLQTLIRPPVEISKRITNITGISNEMVADGISVAEGIQQLADFVGHSTIIAHHAEFDVPWLICVANQHHVELNALHVLCTLQWAKSNREPQLSLGMLSKRYKIQHKNAHRALVDASLTKALYFIFDNQKKSPAPMKSIDVYRGMVRADSAHVPAASS